MFEETTEIPVTTFTKHAFSGFGNGTHYPRIGDFAALEAKVSQQNNIQYDSTYPNSFLDIITPKNELDSKKPVIFWVHGGAFVGGDKTDVRDYSIML